MSVISIGGGPRPQARIVQVSEMAAPTGQGVWFEIRDGNEILYTNLKSSHANVLLPLIQSGE